MKLSQCLADRLVANFMLAGRATSPGTGRKKIFFPKQDTCGLHIRLPGTVPQPFMELVD